MFGSTPAFTDAVAWISADKKKQFFGTQPVYPFGSQPEKHGLVDTYLGGTEGHSAGPCHSAVLQLFPRFENSWEKAA